MSRVMMFMNCVGVGRGSVQEAQDHRSFRTMGRGQKIQPHLGQQDQRT